MEPPTYSLNALAAGGGAPRTAYICQGNQLMAILFALMRSHKLPPPRAVWDAHAEN